jgi:D-alanyl-D-alanine carboxypeptidase
MSQHQKIIKDEAAKRKQREAKILTIAIVIVVIIFCFAAYFLSQHVAIKRAEQAALVLSLELKAKEVLRQQQRAEAEMLFTESQLAARSAYVYDVNTKRALFRKNAVDKLGIASVTKTMTALAAYETIGKEALVQINWTHLLTEGESSLISGEYFRMKDLVDFMMVSSSNDSATAIAQETGAYLLRERGDTGLTPEQTFVAEMNALAVKLGMEQTSFNNPTGLDENFETTLGAISSARDIALLFQYILETYPGLLEATHEPSLRITSKGGYVHNITNTNEIVTTLPNALASKTGYTIQAGGNLAVTIDPGLNNPIIIVVLGSTKDGRFTDVKTLSDATLAYFAKMASFDSK